MSQLGFWSEPIVNWNIIMKVSYSQNTLQMGNRTSLRQIFRLVLINRNLLARKEPEQLRPPINGREEGETSSSLP